MSGEREERIELKVHQVYLLCEKPECNGRCEYRYDETWGYEAPYNVYVHICKTCGDKQYTERTYPYREYVEVSNQPLDG